jgi:hypothetical protein
VERCLNAKSFHYFWASPNVVPPAIGGRCEISPAVAGCMPEGAMQSRRIIFPALRSVALALVLSVAFAARLSAVPAAELVTVAPHAFASRQPLLEYLTRPFGKGPFPAVVLLHVCGGFGTR